MQDNMLTALASDPTNRRCFDPLAGCARISSGCIGTGGCVTRGRLRRQSGGVCLVCTRLGSLCGSKRRIGLRVRSIRCGLRPIDLFDRCAAAGHNCRSEHEGQQTFHEKMHLWFLLNTGRETRMLAKGFHWETG
jgi:hypothetical protein